MAIVRCGPGQVVKSYDTDGTVTYVSASGGLLFLVIIGLLMVLLIAGILANTNVGSTSWRVGTA